MKITNIMCEILKAAKSKKLYKYNFNKSDDYIYITAECYAYRISSENFLLDIDKLVKAGGKEYPNAYKLFECSNAKYAEITGNYKAFNDKTSICIEIKCGDELIYIDEKLLKNFDEKCKFKATHRNTPVYVFENDEVVGIVLPVIFKN